MKQPFSASFRRLAALALLASAPLAAGCGGDPAPQPGAQDPFGPLGDRADLPVTERVSIPNLGAPVDVVRDKDGRPHIYAHSLADAMRVQGYLVAQDRHLQLEFFRRVSEGRLAEMLADADPSVIDIDIVFRHIGLHRTAKKQYEAMGAEERALLDAYADGVTQHFRALREREATLPPAIFAIPPEAFTDWTGPDSLAIARLQSYELSYTGDFELGDTLTFEALRSGFKANDPDPKLAARAGLERDIFRFAPANPAITSTSFPLMSNKSGAPPAPAPSLPNLDGRTIRYREAIERVRNMIAPEGFGSNGWAVSASKSSTGHALVASDPHLTLSSPAAFWPVSIEVDDPAEHLKVSGVAFPGIPGIILGHNEHIAWGSTTNYYDVTDLYAETLTPDGASVVFGGKNVPLETIDEVIQIQGGEPYTYSVKVVPHHGPIQPVITADHKVAPIDPKAGALSVRWTGTEPTNELAAVFSLLRAKNVDEARTALDGFQVGGQNWMIGDTAGNILWTSHVNVPIRDPKALAWDPATYTGTLPCLVLPGDGSAEWKGSLASELVPWTKNPAEGFVATANNDPIGDSLDDDPSNGKLPDGTPLYLGCSWDIGFREGRIHERLSSLPKASPDDMAALQGDARSAMGSTFAPKLIEAIDRSEAERKTPGTHPDLSSVVNDPAYDFQKILRVREILTAWAQQSDYEAAAGIDLDTNEPLPESGETADEARAAAATLVFNTWFVRLIERVLGDELEHMGRPAFGREPRAKALLTLTLSDPSKLVTYDAAVQDSVLWDDLATDSLETRHERMIRALLDALAWLETNAGADIDAYRWGAFHTVRFDALIPLFGQLAIPAVGDQVFPDGFPRHGDNFGVDASDSSLSVRLDKSPNFHYAHGPVQRFVIDLDPAGPRAWNALPGGAVWDSQSSYFQDQAELWRKNQTHLVPFLLPDVVAAAASRTVVTTP
ncbi:penicillin acylase family protein [Polyangium aurulentum]|uniref:penicillin acylase family protein n=1 Tax=Polyangium aurulentum TaxID=2567896 RepID=UPI0010AE916D|nr:penicillin acylase family protein [Polyangium aurulentum]UQA61601.1 penicillin acylase family protein [Polyangium aurulentum]